MQYNTVTRRRRSIRLPGYDYAQAGMYFITICTHERKPLFGEIVDGEMRLNMAGLMVERYWQELANKFPGIYLHEYVIMPNHIHGIIGIVGAPLVGALPLAGALPFVGEIGAPTRGAPTGQSIGNIVGAYKSLTTNAYIRGVQNADWPVFNGRLWQRNYYEHIIRNDAAYLKIAEYIQTNPQQWRDDAYFI